MKRKSGAQAKSTTIRSRLTGVVAVPGLILLAMWAAFSVFTVFDGLQVTDSADAVRETAIPAVSTLSALQRERQATIAALDPNEPEPADLAGRQRATDAALKNLLDAFDRLGGDPIPEVAEPLQRFMQGYQELPRHRADVAAGNAALDETYAFYNRFVDAGLAMFETQARTLPDATMIESSLTVLDIARAGDRMSRAASLGAVAIAGGGFAVDKHVEFTGLVGTYRAVVDAHVAQSVTPLESLVGSLRTSPSWQRLVAAENLLINAGPKRPNLVLQVPAADWATVTDTGSDELIKLATQQVASTVDVVTQRAERRFNAGLFGSGIALVVAFISIAVATGLARRLINRAVVTRLDGLKNDSLRLANERLPEIVERLRRGDQVDVAEEVPPLDYGTDEIGQVADAFNVAQYTAIAAAVKESQAREGVNRVFLGIAHRHQGLVHRQLKILDKIEREEENPEHLDALFQLDHLATRARRNAENLIILAGEQPGRQWRRPVRLLDILRAAVAETEQYVRVRVQQVPDVALHGVAVADTIHLVAELVDNAASFSPPRSQVEVYTSLVSGGVVVEVEDHGLGLTTDDREQANRMLAFPPEFDAMAMRGESRLGLFVVARLAARRSIRVELRESPYGGTVALVFLPSDIVAEAVESDLGAPSPRPRQPAQVHPVHCHQTQTAQSAPPPGEPLWPDDADEAIWPQDDDEAPEPAPATRLDGPTVVTEPVAEPEPAAQTDAPELPRRRRQQHLAPQLREQLPEHDEDTTDREDSADRVRHTMSAFQRGTWEARKADSSAEPR